MSVEKNIGNLAVFEAFENGCECPVCKLMEDSREKYINSLFSEQVMETGFREKLKTKGFCDMHFSALYNKNDKLGLSLILGHMMEDISVRDCFKVPANLKTEKATRSSKLFRRGAHSSNSGENRVCMICEHNDAAERFYIKEILDLWGKNSEFTFLFNNCGGFCMAHFDMMLSLSSKHLDKNDQGDFVEVLCNIQKKGIDEIREDLSAFARKFDYRFKDEPLKNCADSPRRAINKIKGCIIK